MNRWSTVIAVLLVSRAVSAQIPIGEFTATKSEGFESSVASQDACVPRRIFDGTGDFCDALGGHAVSVRSSYGDVGPRSGNRMCIAVRGQVAFDVPAQRFGCYVSADAVALVVRGFDANGNELVSRQLHPHLGVWSWVGFDAGSGPRFGFFTFNAWSYHSQTVLFDDLVYDDGLGCDAPSLVECGRWNGFVGCLTAIGTAGTPSASAGSGFEIAATSIQSGSRCLAFYSVAGLVPGATWGSPRCLAPPLRRASSLVVIGPSGPPWSCDGDLVIDFNSAVASGIDPSLVAGQRVWVQVACFADVGAQGPSSVALPVATFVLCP